MSLMNLSSTSETKYNPMALTSFQVCMDSSDWLQEAESSGSMLDHSSSSSPCATYMRPPPLLPRSMAMEVVAAGMMDGGGRRLRPPQDHPLKCPRCESAHTKFCYYNNYSLSQPRYFCKTCRRYWTKGGTLRNIPVGGGCRKNKKTSSSSASKKALSNTGNYSSTTDLIAGSQQNYQNTPLSLPQFAGMMSSYEAMHNGGFLEHKYGGVVPHNPRLPVDSLDCKFNFTGMNNHRSMVDPGPMLDCHDGVNHGSAMNHGGFQSFHDDSGIMDVSTCQRLMLSTTYDHHHDHSHHNGNFDQDITAMDVKRNPKLLSLDWQQDQSYSDLSIKDGNVYGGYINILNGYGSSR